MSKEISDLDEAVVVVIEGANIYYAAVYMEDVKMAWRGLRRTQAGLDYIDKHSATRDLLLPLLHDQDDGVRITAAQVLFQSWPKLAIPVIQDISENSRSEAGDTATRMLYDKSERGYYCNGVWPDPRYTFPPKPEDG